MSVPFLPLFDEPPPKLVEFLRAAIRPALLDGCLGVLVAPSPATLAPLVREPKPVLEARTPFVLSQTSLHTVTLSGHRDTAHGTAILAEVFEETAHLGEPLPTLHLHLLSATAEPAEPTSATDLYDLVEHPAASWSDLTVPDSLRAEIERNLVVLNRWPTLLDWGFGDIAGFRGRRCVSLSMSGPSGTGKSLAASVIAHELGRRLMIVDYARLESKYVGDTSKHIREVFAAAGELGDTVLFFDEADSFLSSRVQNPRQSYDVAVNNTRAVMLMQLEQFSGVVLFATNLASNYDPAFRRRILAHIEFPMPDERACARILDQHTPARLPGRDTLDFAELGRAGVGLGGGELAGVAYQACLSLLARLDDPAKPQQVLPADVTDAIAAARRARELMPERFTQGLTVLPLDPNHHQPETD